MLLHLGQNIHCMTLPHLGPCITVRPSTLVSPLYILVLHNFNPVLEVDKILAYNTKFKISLPFGRIIGPKTLFSNKYGSFVIERF